MRQTPGFFFFVVREGRSAHCSAHTRMQQQGATSPAHHFTFQAPAPGAGAGGGGAMVGRPITPSQLSPKALPQAAGQPPSPTSRPMASGPSTNPPPQHPMPPSPCSGPGPGPHLHIHPANPQPGAMQTQCPAPGPGPGPYLSYQRPFQADVAVDHQLNVCRLFPGPFLSVTLLDRLVPACMMSVTLGTPAIAGLCPLRLGPRC
jgi:hypothetical protein